MFVRSLIWRSSNRNYSFHMQRVFTQDWMNSFWILLPVLFCLLYCRVNSVLNALEGECMCFCEISINVNKLFTVIFVFCLHCPCDGVVACLLVYSFLDWCCCCLFTSLSLFYTDVIVVACLLPYPFFVLMSLLSFLFICWSC